MENISICSMCVSEFPNVRSKISKEITLEEFFRKVKGESFKRYIEQYRLLRATPGREAEAQRMKDSLPCIVPSGVCRGGHAVKNLVSLSETLCIDLDYTNGRTKEMFARVKALPWVRGAIVSPSGEGVKVFVGIHPEEAKLDYPRLYAEVGEAVSRCVEHPYDEKCRILTQPCFYSWDPEAYFRPDAELFPRFLSDCSRQGSRGVASSATEETSWEGDSFRKSEETFTPFVVEETFVKSGLYTDGRVGEQEAEAFPLRKAATPAKTANQPNQAENQSNELNQTANEPNEQNQRVNQSNEQNRTANQPNQLNQTVNQSGELNQAVNQPNEPNQTVNQPNQLNETVNQLNELNRTVNQSGELNRAANEPNELNRTINQLNEVNRAVDQPNQLNQTINQSNEQNRTANEPNEQNQTVNQSGEQNRTTNEPNKLNQTVNQSNQPNQAVKQLKQPNQTKQAVNQSKPKEPTVSQKLPGMVPHFLDRFEHRNPFVRGQRNDIALKLGREAALHGLSLEELEELTKLFSRHYSGADFTARDIRERIQAGYQFFMNEKKTLPEDIRYQFGIKTPYNPFSAEEEGESTEEVLAFNNDLRAAAPYIPDEVYNTLPPFLQRCVKPATHPRERDILLLGTLNSCSALFPYVRFLYHKAICSPHFYLAVVAPAGAGKGVLSYTSTLLDATQDYYDAKRVKMKKEQEEAQLRWEQEVQTARREKRPVDVSLRAEQSPVPYFKIPATTSKSRLIESLASGGEVGCCMVSTEIVTLSSAIGQDYGRFEDILLKASHHEEVSSSYKADSEPLVARNPHLAVCLAGTQEQFYGFFHSLEVGLFSRFGIYTRQQELKWESCAPKEGEEDLRGYFRTLGKELFTMHEALLQSPTWVTFTPAQWEAHTLRYTELVGRSATDGREATGGVIFRNGLLAMRLAAILTVFRKWDDYRYAREYACSDEDFHSAMTLAGILLEHGLLLSTSLPESQHKPVKMRNPHRLEMILKILPSRFTFMEFIQAASEVGITRPSAARILAQAVSLEVLKKGKKEYRKVKTPVKKGL